VFKNILLSINSTSNAGMKDDVAGDIEQLSPRIAKLNDSTGVWGIVLLCFGTYFFTAAITFAINAVDGNIAKTLLGSLFSATVLARWLYLVVGSVSLAASLIIFYFFYWDGGRVDVGSEYRDSIKKQILRLLFISLLAQPILILVNTLLLPASSLSIAVFGGIIAALGCIFVLYQLIYNMIKGDHVKYANAPLILLVFAAVALVFADQAAIANTSNKNTLIQASEYATANPSDKSAAVGGVINGADVYKAKCSMCHKFDQKVVGPPYKETMPKYAGKLDKLIAFIRNPVKVNPAYGNMPPPGVTAAEAEAVAKYISTEYKKY